MPCILTFAGGFATSVSSNSAQTSSLCVVMDGNIWLKIADCHLEFHVKTAHKDRRPVHSLVQNHTEQIENNVKSTQVFPTLTASPSHKACPAPALQMYIPSFAAFAWQQFLLAGCCCQGRQKGCAAGFSFTCT